MIRPQPERQLGILERVAARIAHQLVILDQAVIRVGGEGQRRQLQRIDSGQTIEAQIRVKLRQHRQVVADDVVAEDESGAFGQRIDRRPGACHLLAGEAQALLRIGPPGRELAQSQLIVCGGLDVETKTVWRKRSMHGLAGAYAEGLI